MLGVLVYALQHFHGESGFLRDFSGGDSRMVRNAFEGALCCSEQKYCMEIEYCSFSRTNELRYLIGDVLKYAENKLRAYLGIKSRLSVYSVTQELREVIDRYFAMALTAPSIPRAKKEAPQAYDVLYDLPKKQFSLADAKKIEQESWQTTNELIAAFEDEEVAECVPLPQNDEPLVTEEVCVSENDFCTALGEFLPFARAVADGDGIKQSSEAERLGKMPDWMVDEINRIAVEIMGDILIEDDGSGYVVIDDYRDMIEN